jgi:hypothetical protein
MKGERGSLGFIPVEQLSMPFSVIIFPELAFSKYNIHHSKALHSLSNTEIQSQLI